MLKMTYIDTKGIDINKQLLNRDLYSLLAIPYWRFPAGHVPGVLLQVPGCAR